MTRLGWRLLILFALVIGGFALLVRRGDISSPYRPEMAPALPSPAVPKAVPAGGPLVVPVSGIQPSQLTDTWGQARAEGAREHHAIDIVAPRGTPVIAAAAGTVEKLFESKDGGHTIYIRRADPAWIDYYAHLDAYVPDLREGLAIKAGQQIGTVGSTGDASPDAPHLHYEIKQMAPGDKWWQGTEINPYPILHR
ncbi:M23 family metallopeptidase [Sphingomonas sp. MMS24-J13]|uniref:M23 family metallopeptidase n=1 Tax=Sphingomonas sp. MMS24-J13 TaxID=3238686 RepID=UPI00384FA6A0